MNITKTLIITNKLKKILNYFNRECLIVEGSHNSEYFKKTITDIVTTNNIDKAIIDVSAFKNKNEMIECLIFINAVLPAHCRMVVLYPNLNDEKIIKTLEQYNIPNIVKPKIEKGTLDTEDTRRTVINAVQEMIDGEKIYPTFNNKNVETLGNRELLDNVKENSILKNETKPEEQKIRKSIKKDIKVDNVEVNEEKYLSNKSIEDLIPDAVIDEIPSKNIDNSETKKVNYNLFFNASSKDVKLFNTDNEKKDVNTDDDYNDIQEYISGEKVEANDDFRVIDKTKKSNIEYTEQSFDNEDIDSAINTYHNDTTKSVDYNMLATRQNNRLNENDKARVLCFYNGKNKLAKSLSKENDKYELVSVNDENMRNVIDETNMSSIDVILLIDTTYNFTDFIKSFVDINKYSIKIVTAYKNEQPDEIKQLKIKNISHKNDKDIFQQQFDGFIATNYRRALSSASNTIVAVYGVKGGAGATTICSTLAKKYSKKNPNKTVLTIEFSAKSGDMAQRFGITNPEPNLFECVSFVLRNQVQHVNIEDIEDKVLDYCHLDNKNHIFVLPTPYYTIYKFCDYSFTTEQLVEAYKTILNILKKKFDIIFLDVTKYGGFAYDLAIENANKILLVSTAKTASVSQLLQHDSELNFIQSKVYAILNKTDVKHLESEYDNFQIVNQHFGKNRVFTIPFDKKLSEDEKDLKLDFSPATGKSLDIIIKNMFDITMDKKKKGLLKGK